MRSLFVPRRVLEATPQQIVASGASASSYGLDPIDSDAGWRRAGRLGRREVPYWSREKAVTHSVAAYRTNPMARAIVDTYAAFCIGDSGVKYECTNPAVSEIVKEFWEDPGNACAASQDVDFRSQLIMGEQLYEMMVGASSGVVRYCPIDPIAISEVLLRAGNPNWVEKIRLGNNEDAGLTGVEERELTAVSVNDDTDLREGQVMFWRPFRTLNTDIRSMPFLSPVLDWLDNYDQILSNLMDRTALGRYMVWDVTVTGGQDEVDRFIRDRLPKGPPTSGGIEVHNESVTWEPKSVTVGADEDSVTAQAAMTMFAGGSGLAKTWLAEPDGANRATSLTMAEPVRRRVGGIQQVWLAQQTELVRFAVDRAVAAGRLAPMVASADPRTGAQTEVRASQTVIVTGPEVAAADATITAQVLLNLSTALSGMVQTEILSPEAAKVAAKKAWEGYVGVPYRAELDSPTANPDDIAQEVDNANVTESPHLRLAK